MFDPDSRGIIHYKARRYFSGQRCDGRDGVDRIRVRPQRHRRDEGTWRDAEDGELSMNAIQQGAVDSTIALRSTLEPLGTATAFYWICAGTPLRRGARARPATS